MTSRIKRFTGPEEILTAEVLATLEADAQLARTARDRTRAVLKIIAALAVTGVTVWNPAAGAAVGPLALRLVDRIDDGSLEELDGESFGRELRGLLDTLRQLRGAT